MSLLALASLAAAQPALDAPDYTLAQNWICLPGGDVKFNLCNDFFCHNALYIFSTCQYSNSTNVDRPKIETLTFNFPRSG